MALPPGSAEDLAASADSILVGVLTRVSIRDEGAAGGFADRHYELRLEVESVEKGAGVRQVTVTGWTAEARPAGWTGPTGVDGLSGLKAGDRVRVYLRDSALVEPNGLESLPASDYRTAEE